MSVGKNKLFQVYSDGIVMLNFFWGGGLFVNHCQFDSAVQQFQWSCKKTYLIFDFCISDLIVKIVLKCTE